MKRLLLLFVLVWSACSAPLAAREVIPLNEGWRFFFQSEMSADQARSVVLPHTWNTDPVNGEHFVETTGCYLNTLYIPSEWSAKRLFVKFYGAQRVADLFVNGKFAGTHRGGATAFVFEITDQVRFGVDNELLVTVSNNRLSDVLPTSTDINPYGGLYRGAELIVTAQQTISPLYCGSDGVLIHTQQADASTASGEVEVHLSTRGEQPASLVTVSIENAEGISLLTQRQRVEASDTSVRVPFSLDEPQLWSLETPNLYTFTVTLGSDTEEFDRVRVRTGFRLLQVTPAGGLTLNGQRVPVRGVVLYHDNALSGGIPSHQDLEADLAQAADLGANAIRSAVMPHEDYLYDRCDESGVLAWIDLPFHRAFLIDAAYYPTAAFEENGMQQLREIIAQHINHPSVVMWGLFSRLWMRGDNPVPYLQKLQALARELDPSRPTVGCSDQDGDINFVTDLIVWRQNVGWSKGSPDDLTVWRDLLQKNWSHLRSAISYGGGGLPGHRAQKGMGFADANSQPEERQTRFHEEYCRNLQGDQLLWGVWIENLYDYASTRYRFGVDGKGLIGFDHRTPKDAYYLYRTLWNPQSPTLYLTGRHRMRRDQLKESFTVYSSAGAPVVVLGSDTLAVKEYAAGQYRTDSVDLPQGRCVVRAIAGDRCDSIILQTDNAAKRFLRTAPRRKGGR